MAAKLKKIALPRIAVCGLNPHAGEGGILGKEEAECINPVLDRLREKYPNLSEALPPDTVFARQLKGEFDVSVAGTGIAIASRTPEKKKIAEYTAILYLGEVDEVNRTIEILPNNQIF